MPKLTKRMVEELETRKSDYFVWDNGVQHTTPVIQTNSRGLFYRFIGAGSGRFSSNHFMSTWASFKFSNRTVVSPALFLLADGNTFSTD